MAADSLGRSFIVQSAASFKSGTSPALSSQLLKKKRCQDWRGGKECSPQSDGANKSCLLCREREDLGKGREQRSE